MSTTIFNANTSELTQAHIGPALIFIAPFGTTFPTAISDVINITGASQWLPKTNWSCLGATKTGIKIERGFSKVDRSSDQSFGPFDSRPNNFTASVMTELLQTTPTNLQIGWEGGVVSQDTASNTTSLTAAAAVGASSLVVASATGLVSGSLLIVGKNSGQEWHTLAAVSGLTVTFAAGEVLTYAQVSGEFVLNPGTSSQGFGRPRSLTPRLVTVIAPLTKVDRTNAKGNVDLLRMWAFRLTRLSDGQKTMTLSQDNDWVLPTGFNAYKDPTITDETIDTFIMRDLTL